MNTCIIDFKIFLSIYSSQKHTMTLHIEFWLQNPYTLAGFESGILCSWGRRDDHYALRPVF
jgi:hypothetical protein